ncbi:MAG: tyrosine--tRNA ligase [Alphaproteobacteria bacterium]|nr:tyrosine--tRNA ligase [Alphaproteobacteria bacterium]
MSTATSDFLHRLYARGFVHQCTDLEGLDALARESVITAYIGFDCTAPSLHVGSLIQIMLLRILQQTGHKPIVLMGGGTTKVGDPSGKDDTRQLLSPEQIAANMAGIKRVFEQYVQFGDGPTDAVMVDNADWLDKLAYIDLLRHVGRHFSVNRMLTMDSVKLRLDRDQPLSFLEFNYMVLQSYDFVELYRRYGCRLQLGGSDQWGNIVCGIDLGRRMAQAELFGVTTPLLTTASGAKMGKTAEGAVWLNADMLSVFDYWQFWRNCEDADVGRFLRLFTEVEEAEIARLEALEGAELNDAKKILATEATALCHGRDAAEQAARTAREVFEQGAAAAGLPTLDVPRAEIAAGVPLFALLVRTGLAKSSGEARRLIKGGGARLNDAVVSDEQRLVTADDLDADGQLKLSFGKKRHALVRPI